MLPRNPPPVPTSKWSERFRRIDLRVKGVLARASPTVLRIGLGIVFLWFGLLKFFPAASPAEELATRTIAQLSFGTLRPEVALPLLAVWECLIGIGLLAGRFLRVTLLLLAVQMLGTFAPLVLFPNETFTYFPYAPTLEGQYIIKNIVLIGAGMAIGARVRGAKSRRVPAVPKASRS